MKKAIVALGVVAAVNLAATVGLGFIVNGQSAYIDTLESRIFFAERREASGKIEYLIIDPDVNLDGLNKLAADYAAKVNDTIVRGGLRDTPINPNIISSVTPINADGGDRRVGASVLFLGTPTAQVSINSILRPYFQVPSRDAVAFAALGVRQTDQYYAVEGFRIAAGADFNRQALRALPWQPNPDRWDNSVYITRSKN
ncbi:hypothetical protein HYU40_01960 [Candidatus Woesearchaeota archaeon]|nr:hypothetical protein [Candidatus Woesearchaeota archaeon]